MRLSTLFRNFLNEKYFQMSWLIINIIRFIFMTTNERLVNVPLSVRDIDECNDFFLTIKDELYKNFVGFSVASNLKVEFNY